MTTLTKCTLFALALAAAAGCGHRPIGHFGEGAFYHARRHYRIRYAAPDALLSERWEVANYRRDDAGRPTEEDLEASGRRTLDTQWLVGRGASRRFEVPTYDLVLRQRAGTGRIWVRTLVLPRAWATARPDVILHAWAASEDVGAPSAVTYYGDATVDGRPAHWVELDHPSRADVRERTTVVAVRPGGHEYRWRRRHQFPMILLFGYTSSPDDHDAVRRDFEALVQRVDIRG